MKTLSNNYNTVWERNYQNFIFKVEKIKTMDNSTVNCVYAVNCHITTQSKQHVPLFCLHRCWQINLQERGGGDGASNANISHSNLSLCVR